MKIATSNKGFTLIEMSIVLVIIGLIVGGVLVGQDLIRAAEIRATLSQIEKYNTAVNTFYGKYQALPGDANLSTATQYNLPWAIYRGARGDGDGNGIIEGDRGGGYRGVAEGAGETVMFWEDLSFASLVDGGFATALPNNYPAFISGGPVYIGDTSVPSLNAMFPQAKMGHGNYIMVYSGGSFGSNWDSDGYNYFALSHPNQLFIGNALASYVDDFAGLTVTQAYNIDRKIDDGFPQQAG